jgi:hypothetical protein
MSPRYLVQVRHSSVGPWHTVMSRSNEVSAQNQADAYAARRWLCPGATSRRLYAYVRVARDGISVYDPRAPTPEAT